MKRNFKRILALALVLAMCLAPAAMAAEARSSDYINYATPSAASKNGVTFTFTVSATGVMTDLGATKIVVKTSSGTTVKTYNYTDNDYAYLMGHGCKSYTASVSYHGFPGNQYYAVIYLKAGNSSGYDTRTITTPVVTAVKDY